MFKVKDPFKNTVILTDDCWNNHIVVRHPIMKHFLKQLKSTIRYPNYIYRSKYESQTRLYYQLNHTKYGEIYILAIIDMKPNKKIGYVKTALPIYEIRGGELLWKKT